MFFGWFGNMLVMNTDVSQNREPLLGLVFFREPKRNPPGRGHQVEKHTHTVDAHNFI